MSGVRGCPMCGSGNAVEAVTCWVCGASFAQGSAPAPSALAQQRDQTYGSTQTFRVLGWVAFLLGIFFICTLVAVELALEWPGLLIPFAVITLVIFSALGRIAYVQLKKPPPAPPSGAPTQAAGGGAAKKGGVTGTEVIQGVAMGLAVAGAIIAGMMLLFVAAMVIFFLICLAMIAGMS